MEHALEVATFKLRFSNPKNKIESSFKMRRYAGINLIIIILSSFAFLSFGKNPININSSLSTDEIVRRMFEKYGLISYYQDEGYVVAKKLNGTIEGPFRRDFKTYFARPNLFRFELRYKYGTQGDEKVEVLRSDGEQIIILRDGKIEKVENINEGIAKIAGISLGSSVFVPSLLFKIKDNFILSDLVNLSLEKFGQIEDDFYWVVSGKHPKKETSFFIWIRKDDFIVHKLMYKIGTYGPPTMIEEIHKKISINKTIPKECFF